MKAITLHQPWASLIAEGIKTTETRSWAPPGWLLGSRIAIHAAKRKPRIDELNAQIFITLEEAFPNGEIYMPFGVATRLPRGKIVATARLVSAGQVIERRGTLVGLDTDIGDLHIIESDPCGDYSVGRWIWFLEDIRKLDKPIAVRGMQRIWNLPAEIAEQVR